MTKYDGVRQETTTTFFHQQVQRELGPKSARNNLGKIERASFRRGAVVELYKNESRRSLVISQLVASTAATAVQQQVQKASDFQRNIVVY